MKINYGQYTKKEYWTRLVMGMVFGAVVILFFYGVYSMVVGIGEQIVCNVVNPEYLKPGICD